MIKEAEDKKMKFCDDSQNEISSVENKNESIMEIVKEYMMMLTDAEVQEFCDFKVDYFYESVKHEEALENHNFVFVVGEDEPTLISCTKGERILHNDIFQENLILELLNDIFVSKQGIFCNEQESAQMKFIDSFINFAEVQYKDLMVELYLETEIHSTME